jgi:hypothetical protein
VFRLSPLPIHLWADIAIGMLLAASPFVLGFWNEFWLPHFFSVTLTAAGLMTRSITSEGAELERDVTWPLTGSPMSAMPQMDRAATADGRLGGPGHDHDTANAAQPRYTIDSG